MVIQFPKRKSQIIYGYSNELQARFASGGMLMAQAYLNVAVPDVLKAQVAKLSGLPFQMRLPI